MRPAAAALSCNPSSDTLRWRVIRSFRQKGLESFFRTGSKAGIQPAQAAKLRVQLTALDFAKRPEDMNAPGWRWHRLKGERREFYSITVNGNWRLIFRFDGTDAHLVDYLGYH